MPGLPLTPIERYFYHDHRESHPAWIRYEFTFRGAFDRAALGRAWERIGQRHPLTGAIVAERRWGGPVWQTGAARPELVWDAAGDAEAGEAARDRHDLAARAGLRGIVRPRAAETHLTLLAHHAVADGLGLLLIAEDLFALYAIECGAAITLPAVAPLDARRDGAPPGGVEGGRQWPWLALGVVWGAVLGRQRVVELRGAGGGGPRRELAPRSCPADETARLRAAARAAGVSLNELLIRDVQVALGAWLERHGSARPEAWTRLLVPVNVGGTRSESQRAANALGVALIERRVKALGRRARLLQRAHEDMEFIRRRGLMRAFGAALRVRGWLPGAIARHCRRGGARSTLVFSNLGNVFGRGPLVRPDGVLAVPGAELTAFAGWGPCRPGTSVFVMTAAYRDAQTWGVAFDPAALSVAEAEDFARELEAQRRRSLAGE
jgi:hypothetical protein